MTKESKVLDFVEYKDGDLYFKKCNAKSDAWNGRWAGKKVKGVVPKGGREGNEYKFLRYKESGKVRHALFHRIIYTQVFGEIPDGYLVDHIDGNNMNNHPLNLRLATPSTNQRNRKLNANNKTGCKGIHIQDGKFKVKCAGRYFGIFDNLDDAVVARRNAEAQMGGRFLSRL
jgi:hypothetical protein